MKKHIYMISQGEYSDFMVGGLYKSEQRLDKDAITLFMADMIRETFPELSNWADEFAMKGSLYKVHKSICEAIFGKEPDMNNEKEWSAYCKVSTEVDESMPNLIDFLEKKGIVEKVEYRQLHLNEGWVTGEWH